MADIPFKKLTKSQQVAKVRAAMGKGHSNTTAAEALGTTPGTIAGIRHREKIPSKNRPKGRRMPETASGKPKLAASEAVQCEHRSTGVGPRCAYERTAKSRYCRMHGG